MALMAITSLTPGKAQPPLAQAPIAPNGAEHTQAWIDFFQKLADQVGASQTGVADGSDAAAGQIGEYLSAPASGTGLSSGNVAAIASLPLTAGDWAIEGNVLFAAAGTTHPAEIVAGVSTSATVFGSAYVQLGTAFNVGAVMRIGTGGAVRISTASPVTMYLLARSTFSVSGVTASGLIWARRTR